jgi:hypothetical protein
MSDFEQLKLNVEVILKGLSDSLKIEWQFNNCSVEWNITQKPVGFSSED